MRHFVGDYVWKTDVRNTKIVDVIAALTDYGLLYTTPVSPFAVFLRI
jgi:hypothetical protein